VRCRPRERHAARDLLLEEEADDLALHVGLDLLARDHDQRPLASQFDDLERAAEDVVIRDGDRAQAFCLGMIDERERLDRAVVRPARVHMEIDGDPVAIAEKIGLTHRARRDVPPSAGCLPVKRLQVLGEAVEICEHGLLACLRRFRRAQSLILGKARDCRRCELGLLGDTSGLGDRATARSCLEREASAAAGSRNEDRRLGQRGSPQLCLHERPHAGPVAQLRRDRRAAGQWGRPGENELPGRKGRQQAEHRLRDRALAGSELDDDDLPLGGRRKRRGVDTDRNALVVPRKAVGRIRNRFVGGAEQNVDPGEQLGALVLARRHCNPLR